jgi:putative ABC transport system permease protein
VAPGADAENARAAIETALTPFPHVTLADRAEFKATQEAQLNGLLIAVNGLLALALFIALMGIANTLALSVLERTREIGLLRAVGMLRRQVRQMVLTEAVTVALFGAALGVAVGMLFGAATASALPESAVRAVAVPGGTLVGIVVAAAVFGTLAGLLPARRAARLDILRAISSE